MEYYVGLGILLKQTSICVVDQTGSVVRKGAVDFRPEAISVYVRSMAPHAVHGLETEPTSTWLWTELKELGQPGDLHRCAPRRGQTIGPARTSVGELDTQTRN